MLPALLMAVLVLSWVAIVGLAFCVFALARQVGVLHERVAPVGALSMSKGPAVGERVPRLAATSVDGREVVIGAPRPSGRRVLLLFVSAQCPICKVLLPVAKRFAREELLDLILVGDAPLEEQRAFIEKFDLRGIDFVNSPQIGLTFQVGKLPYRGAHRQRRLRSSPRAWSTAASTWKASCLPRKPASHRSKPISRPRSAPPKKPHTRRGPCQRTPSTR